ncbi:MAG TPA: diaminopimelate epimerase [Candidatus Binataceae bacterium]|nr:diaminopimelate epimerase [Candidatus Binataceae bacterium]
MATLQFVKMQGCGNDYIYVDGREVRPADPAVLSARLSHRHFGIGADGMILYGPSDHADIRMEMYNSDGSRGSMCGNGIRCLARLVYESGIVKSNPMIVETDAGPRQIELKLEGESVSAVTVDMGEPVLDGREIPVGASGRVVDHPLEVAGLRQLITAVSMGNPHCVVFVADDTVFKFNDTDFAVLGRGFETHPFFPRRVNTEFVQPIMRRHLRLRVWERGAGETWACGTGACAALVAAVLTGRAERRATVELRGGRLDIEWRESGPKANHVFMTGNAIVVYRGQVELPDAEMVSVGG